MSHHPSCRPTDRNLFWYCSQCGTHEPAEEEILARLARQREALGKVSDFLYGLNADTLPPLKRLAYQEAVGEVNAALAQDAHPTEAP